MAAPTTCLIILLFITATSANNRRDAFIERINNGMKLAKEYFGMDSAATRAAEFVMKAFHHAPPRAQTNEPADEHTTQHSAQHTEPFGLLRNIVKLFGLEPSQISAVAVNAIILVAQMITTFLAKPNTLQRGRAAAFGESTAWIIDRKSSKLQSLLTLARNESLPNILEDYVKGDGDEETSCVQLLVCKMTPFVSRMQAAVFRAEEGEGPGGWGGPAVLYRHLPDRQQVEAQGADCERRHPACDLKH